MQEQRTSVYDRLRPHLDAADLIQRLGLTLSRTVGSEARCRPLCHESESGESLHVNLHTGRWLCRACQPSGVYGDLFQLVEYARSGGQPPSRGATQGGSQGHRDAIEWLCGQFGLPFELGKLSSDDGLDVLHYFAMRAHESLLGMPDALAWILEKWGFDLATVQSHGIGFVTTPIPAEVAAEADRADCRAAFRASGLGWYDADGRWHTHFEGRVTFPYLEHGRAVYLIGRATPWTPRMEDGRRPPKYHKLSVHSETRPHVSERITNDHLYNEPVMSSADSVVVAEGVADAVALSALGVPVVSPVTISFNATDLERFSRKAGEFKISAVEILFDNELSGSGQWAARRVASKLVERGLVAKILTLPLGDEQLRARDEVLRELGDEAFEQLERSDPRERKQLIAESVTDEGRRAWVEENVDLTKIDAAEWCALGGAGAPGRFDAIRKAGQDVVSVEVAAVVRGLDPEAPPTKRAAAFDAVISLAAHVDDRLARASYAGEIAKAAGRGVTKAEISRRISEHRRDHVAPSRKKQDAKGEPDRKEALSGLVLLPPEGTHVQAAAPTLPGPPTGGTVSPDAPPPPPPPAPPGEQSDHDRYAAARKAVARAVEARVDEESLGQYVAQTMTRSMGYTPFRTPDELYLVRGSERVPVGLTSRTPRFSNLLWLASGLTPQKSSHRPYIAAAIYFLERDSRQVRDVSWSHVDADGAVYFPTGDAVGRIFKIEPGRLTRTKMAEVRVPAVAGHEWLPIEVVDGRGWIDHVLGVLRWCSLSDHDRAVLVYWLVCLPILRRVGTIPIVRVEGGSSSGKTRTVDAVSYLVNGQRSSSVPTPSALTSRMSTEMLTIDDNRETSDIKPAFLTTLLQATHLGAREKRKSGSDTGTVVERICGAVLMSGVEPIHDGKAELASRMVVLRCSDDHRVGGSPADEGPLREALVGARSGFWCEAAARCTGALELDAAHGDRLGAEIEEIFGRTRIGRCQAYLRLMYLAWVAGFDGQQREAALERISPWWRAAFSRIAGLAMTSLVDEELAVTAVRYVMAWGSATAQAAYAGAERVGLEGKYHEDPETGEAILGPVRASQLARLARHAGREQNAPWGISYGLRVGQLDRRIADGLGYFDVAGIEVLVDETRKGKRRFTFRVSGDSAQTGVRPSDPGGESDVDDFLES